MAKKFYAWLGSGKAPIHIPEAKRFSHYVDNVRFWFAYHKNVSAINTVTISHFDTGMRVCDVDFHTIQAHLGDTKRAAKYRLDRLVSSSERGRVSDVLRRAESEKYGMLSYKGEGVQA